VTRLRIGLERMAGRPRAPAPTTTFVRVLVAVLGLMVLALGMARSCVEQVDDVIPPASAPAREVSPGFRCCGCSLDSLAAPGKGPGLPSTLIEI
jgi:hypothetical protein